MFKFLKKGLKSVVGSFSKKAEEELEKEDLPEEKPEQKEQAPAEEPEEKIRQEEKTKETPEPSEETVKKEEKPPAEPEEKIQKEPAKSPEPEKKEEKAKDSDFSKNIEAVRADLKQKEQEIRNEEKEASRGILDRIKDTFKKKPVEEKTKPEKEEKGLLGKVKQTVTTTKISEKKFEELFEEMEIVLLENNVALEVIDKIRSDLKSSVVDKPLKRGEVEKAVAGSLKQSVEELFEVEKIDLVSKAKEKKPFVIVFAGINGSGKTTTIAKVANMLQEKGMKVVMAASDTFRAAAIHQLQEHADKLGIKLIKQDYGSDPAAVAFDAVKHAEAGGIDAVLIDTAGRQHSNKNLMEEMKKVVRVAKPDLKVFVGESITGNDCVEQARNFNDAIGIDGIILTKADVDEKGGAAISVSYVTKKPVMYIGTGQKYEDIMPFRSELVVESLELAA